MLDNIKNKFKNFKPYINGWDHMSISSVLIPIVIKDNKEYILFQVRSKNLKNQPSEISFPGGRHEKNEHPMDCAIRETCEELGTCQDNIDIISEMDLFINPFNIIIHPYLGYIKDLNNIDINKDEVDHIFLVPLDFLINTTPLVFPHEVSVVVHDDFPYDIIPNKHDYKFKTGTYDSLFYIYNDYVIWGITAQILYNFLNHLK